MKKLFLLLLLLASYSAAYCQKQGNIWYFGNHAGLDFSSGIPVALTNGQTSFVGCPGCVSEGSSIICDSTGALLFYCNCRTIWNVNQQIMPNGDSLLSNASSTQGALIVPQPGSSRFYYVFTVDDFNLDFLKYGFRYSIVDMCLDNGLGDVVSGKKNILLLDTVSEKLTAVKDSAGSGYWVLVHKYFSDAFYAYHLTASGLSAPVITHVGSHHPTGLQNLGGAIGQMKASPDGHRIALVNGNSSHNLAECFNFDNGTGTVTDSINLQWDSIYNFYGVSFSPDNSKLYIACCLNGNGIYQFNLAAGGGNHDSIRASRTKIATYYDYLGLQLANNGKIYSAHTPFNSNTYLAVINYPNNAGLSCNYVDSAVSLNGNVASYGLPNFIDSYQYTNTLAPCPLRTEEQNIDKSVTVYPNPSHGKFTIQLHAEELSDKTVVEIYNMLGEKVYSSPYPIHSSIYQINISSQPAGLYMYRIISEKGEVLSTRKFIIE